MKSLGERNSSILERTNLCQRSLLGLQTNKGFLKFFFNCLHNKWKKFAGFVTLQTNMLAF